MARNKSRQQLSIPVEPRPAPTAIATYRVQLTEEFDFLDVIGILEHLRDLGISHLYLSPIGIATAGSTHGYDWLPPPGVAPKLGGVDGLRALRAAATSVGIGLIVDIVPNHTGVADVLANPWFADLLRRGTQSPFVKFFDVDLRADNGCDGLIALPVLAADGDLTPLEVDRSGPNAPSLRYYDHAFPIAPGTDTNTDTSDPGAVDPVAVHDRQHYRLVPWNSGLIGYRRFFTVNELAGLRQENPEVYAATHDWLRRLIDDGLIDGLRVDHPDGLWAPQQYLQQLRTDLGPDRLLYIEKILAADEALEPSLPVQGTTGYDQLRVIESLFTAPSGVVALGETFEHVTGMPGDARSLAEAEYERKLTTLRDSFAAEHRRLIRALRDTPAIDGQTTALLSRSELAAATAELIAQLDVYRADYPSLQPRLHAAADRIAARHPRLANAVAQVVAAATPPGVVSARLAQTCGAVTAKSVEDSLFYRTARLVSTQEVGCDPSDPVMTLREFHDHNVIRAELWPQAMTATSTHDTKRGEDVRARIAILSQVPERWSMLVHDVLKNSPAPDAFTGYFLLQNVIGVWPQNGVIDEPLRARLIDYARKATREAGLHTSWTDVDEEFEASVTAWIDELLTVRAATISGFVALIAPAWRQESLARKAVALLGPGVPDIYQGTQWFEDSLVDPDNRRPVDYRQSTDHPKVELVRTALSVRAHHPGAFGPEGSYRAIYADGPAADHVVAFTRNAGTGEDAQPDVVVITARFTHSLQDTAAAETTIPLPWGHWIDQRGTKHHRSVTLAAVRAQDPVAILTRI